MKMRAIDAAVHVLEREGVTHAFGVPGAAINPLYSALKARGSITHILARHVEGASHMAEGYTRAIAGNIGVCIGTSGPAGTDMITGLYSASADSIPILCITGQAPRARMHKEDFQAVDITAIAKPVCKWATTVMEPAQVPRAFQQAFHLMRSGRPGPVLIDLPFDVEIEPTQIGRVFPPDFGIVSDAGAALELFVEIAREWKAAGKLKDRSEWVAQCAERKRTMLRKTNFENVPMKPQRVYQCLNRAFDDPHDTCYVTTIGLSQISAAQFLHVYKPRNWINCGQAGPLGWTIPAALGVRTADPTRPNIALSGDYDFQFMIEELAVGAQFKLPYLHIVVNNSYLGLIRQAQRGFNMDYQVSLAFDNINAPETGGYGVDHVKVAEGLGCKAIRVHKQEEIEPAIEQAEKWMTQYGVPVIVEIILERVTNIAMGTEIDNVVEFEELAKGKEDAPTAVALLD